MPCTVVRLGYVVAVLSTIRPTGVFFLLCAQLRNVYRTLLARTLQVRTRQVRTLQVSISQVRTRQVAF